MTFESENQFSHEKHKSHDHKHTHEHKSAEAFHHELHIHYHHHKKSHYGQWHAKSIKRSGHSTLDERTDGDRIPQSPYFPEVRLQPAEFPTHSLDSKKFAADASPTAATKGSLKAAVERAKNGGRKLIISQVGDSHIAAGIETPAFADEIARATGLRPDQVSATYYGNPGKTAEYADSHLNEFLSKISPNSDLVVLSFGSNDSAGNMTSRYAERYLDLLQKIHERAPHAAVVAAGPTDGNVWNTDEHLPSIDAVIQAQRTAAKEVPNTPYIDFKEQFGNVYHLRKEGYMRPDRLHLTPSGYKALGKALGDDIMKLDL